MSKDVLKKLNNFSDIIFKARVGLEKAGEEKRATYDTARYIQQLERNRRALQGELSPLRVVENNDA